MEDNVSNSVFHADSESDIFFYSVIVDFSMHKVRFKVFFGILEQYVLEDRPEGRCFATSFHRSFIALGNCY